MTSGRKIVWTQVMVLDLEMIYAAPLDRMERGRLVAYFAKDHRICVDAVLRYARKIGLRKPPPDPWVRGPGYYSWKLQPRKFWKPGDMEAFEEARKEPDYLRRSAKLHAAAKITGHTVGAAKQRRYQLQKRGRACAVSGEQTKDAGTQSWPDQHRLSTSL